VKFQFLQLFLNLIGNALKFTKQGIQPHIIVSYELTEPAAIAPDGTKGPHHHIQVADNGIGFDQAFSGKIFQMFHRLHGRTEFEGTGIGLAICKKIIEKHGGVIVAEGKPGVGATFHIYLPTH
jgi:signal transduction histidine kinase